jgi:hypothetical protein
VLTGLLIVYRKLRTIVCQKGGTRCTGQYCLLHCHGVSRSNETSVCEYKKCTVARSGRSLQSEFRFEEKECATRWYEAYAAKKETRPLAWAVYYLLRLITGILVLLDVVVRVRVLVR